MSRSRDDVDLHQKWLWAGGSIDAAMHYAGRHECWLCLPVWRELEVYPKGQQRV